MDRAKGVSLTKSCLVWTLIHGYVIHACLGYKQFQNILPNGDRVPNPCTEAELWPGVGHLSPAGAGPRNPFGQKFNRNLPWNQICPEDWDEDGRSNGEELGDPDCTWNQQAGFEPATTDLSHPGVCEPVDSDFCRQKNSAAGLTLCPGNHSAPEACEAINERDTESMDLRINASTVPTQITTYSCQIFELPFNDNQTFDLFSARPIIGNREVLHHMVLFGCDSNDDRALPSRGLFSCFMNDKTGCRSMISAFAAWDPDVNAFCVPAHVGVRLGHGGFKRLMIQYHWTNVAMTPGLTDDSGVKLFFTPRLRTYTSGMLMVGQTYLKIPPGRKSSTFSGGCVEECSRHRIKAPVKVIDLFHHMHYLGREQSVEIYRNGRRVHLLSNETDFEYNLPKFFRFENPVELLPGDYLKTTCTFDSAKTNRTTFFGQGTLDEMCFVFVRFYPLENLPLFEGGCSEFKTVPLCKVYGPIQHIVDGCDTRKFLNTTDPDRKRMFANVLQSCQLYDTCLPECNAALKDALKHPCLKNDIGDLVKTFFLTSSSENLRFLAAMNICSASCTNVSINHGASNGGTSAGNFRQMSELPVVVMVCLALIMSNY